MSVTIRLSRIGKKHAPSYRIVATKTKGKRDGKFLDLIGVYNPSDKSLPFTYDKEKYAQWTGNGALVSPAVKELIEGKYVHKAYEPNKKAEEPAAEVAATTEAEVATEA